MKYLLITCVVLSLIACTDPNSSVIIEIKEAGLFENGHEIKDLNDFFREVENLDSRSLIFMVNDNSKTEDLVKAMITSKQYKFKAVSISSL